MTKQKSTKHALLTSALALLLCMSMLVGSTFAWFTDSVTSSGNKIQSGTLKVDLEVLDKDGNWNSIKENKTALFNYDKWEPGYTEFKVLKVENEGSLALKWIAKFVSASELSELADVIDVYVCPSATELAYPADRSLAGYKKVGTVAEFVNTIEETTKGELKAGEKAYLGIALKMQDEADNIYQGMDLGGTFDIQILATQLTSEFDSFDNQYDKMATIDDESELLEALAADYDLIQLGANIILSDSVVIPAGKTVAIDLAGFTMSQVNAQQTAAYAMIENKGTLTIKDSVGTGKISYEDATPYTADPGWASNTIRNEGTLTVNGGTVENLTSEAVMDYGYPHAIDAYQGSLTTINGGTVKSLNYDSIRMFCNSETVVTKVVINGGTIINRISFQDPQSTRPGYGILEINGGNFVTMNGVNANVRLLNFCKNCSNMKATVTGGTFDKGFKTQDLANSGITTSDWLTYAGATDVVTDAAGLQKALTDAEDGDVIMFAADIKGDVTFVAKENVKVTINGNGKTMNGTITVNGKSATIRSSALTIKNVNFIADTVSTEACVNMGVKDNENTRYICNLTVENCSFDVPGKVAVKSYSNGDKNLKIIGCTVAEGMHSLLQVNNVGEGLLVEKCKVYSKNGINVNQSENVTIKGCEVDVLGYAVRFGASSGGTGYAETYSIENCTLISANDDGDATVILRGTADNSTLNITTTTIIGNPDITNTTNATVNQ